MKKLLSGLCGIVLLCGCDGPAMRPDGLADVRIGQVCKVQFRRDVGGVAPSPEAPPVESLVGVLKAKGDNWITISNPSNDDESSYVIPTHTILFVQVFPKIKPSEAFPKRAPGAGAAGESTAPK